jgi:hypothetical protein
LLRHRFGTSTLLSLPQLPSSLPLLCDCYRPSTLTEESSQKKEKAEKVYFYLRQQLLRKTNLDPIFSESRFGTIAHKNKNELQQASTATPLQAPVLAWDVAPVLAEGGGSQGLVVLGNPISPCSFCLELFYLLLWKFSRMLL